MPRLSLEELRALQSGDKVLYLDESSPRAGVRFMQAYKIEKILGNLIYIITSHEKELGIEYKRFSKI
jgi:hypothetical protein